VKLLAFVLTPWLLAQGPPPQPQQATQRELMLLPQAVVLPREGREIAIDGSLIDWPELPAIRLDDQRQLSGTAPGAWNGPKDFSAIAFLMWDENALYVACAVRDEWHRALDANTLLLSEVPAADSVVFTFDPDRNTRSSGPDPGRQEDREFWLADETAREVVQWDRLRGAARVLDGKVARMVVVHDKEQGITTHEAKIPWSEILPPGRKANSGLVLDLQIVVNDFDESTDGMAQTRIGWTFGCSPAVDPGLFASIMLVPDREAMQGRVPTFPAKPGTQPAPLKTSEYWHDLTARQLKRPPVVHDGSSAPEAVGGIERLAVLEELDAHCERFPRVDYVEFNQRIGRRMSREVAGISSRGLPYWWSTRLTAVSKAAEDPVPAGTMRLFRLPMGGWLVRTAVKNFAIDPAGADLPEWLFGQMDFCVLTQPLDMTRRNDQLLVRMLLAKPPHPVLTHIAFHLPLVSMQAVPLVEPGQDCGPPEGIKIQALGKKQSDGSVPWSCSYRLSLPDGPSLLVIGPTLHADEVGAEPVDVMLLSPRNAEALTIVRKVAPRLVVLDDSFLCQSFPNIPRIGLRTLHTLQKALQPQKSLLLAPGESWDVTAPR